MNDAEFDFADGRSLRRVFRDNPDILAIDTSGGALASFRTFQSTTTLIKQIISGEQEFSLEALRAATDFIKNGITKDPGGMAKIHNRDFEFDLPLVPGGKLGIAFQALTSTSDDQVVLRVTLSPEYVRLPSEHSLTKELRDQLMGTYDFANGVPWRDSLNVRLVPGETLRVSEDLVTSNPLSISDHRFNYALEAGIIRSTIDGDRHLILTVKDALGIPTAQFALSSEETVFTKPTLAESPTTDVRLSIRREISPDGHGVLVFHSLGTAQCELRIK